MPGQTLQAGFIMKLREVDYVNSYQKILIGGESEKMVEQYVVGTSTYYQFFFIVGKYFVNLLQHDKVILDYQPWVEIDWLRKVSNDMPWSIIEDFIKDDLE